jgi:hypothetical protein
MLDASRTVTYGSRDPFIPMPYCWRIPMNNSFSRTPSGRPTIETLENRTLLSGAASAVVNAGSAVERTAVEVAAKPVKKAPTKTTLAVSAGTLGQPVTFDVTVRAPVAAGSPAGTVNIIDRGNVIETITLSPTTSTNPKYAFSEGAITLTQPPGGSAYYFGNHAVRATFIPAGLFNKSSAGKAFKVSKPVYTITAGIAYETIATGSGPAIQTGQTANSLYTGYLAKNGHIFDDSINDGGSTLPYQLGAGSVIYGFDQGTLGMQVGETRIILIPPAAGYGKTANGPIPANSTLIFVVTLESIS